MSRITIVLLLVSLSLPTIGQDVKTNYQNAFDELDKMLRGEVPMSFKRAVFVTENAYLDNSLNYYNDYLKPIDALVRMSKAVASMDGLDYQYKDREQVLLSASIFRLMKDSLVFESPDKGSSFKTTPYKYDMNDFWGEKDWTKMFVIKLLYTQSGNCHSLPALYKILAEELNVKAYLAVTPNHTYVKQWCDKDGWYNTELTTGRFPFDSDIKFNSYIKDESIASGVYMDTLSEKETVAYVLTDLAQGYSRKTNYSDLTTAINWVDVALKYYPDYVSALIFKAELEKKQYEHSKKDQTMFAQLEQEYGNIHKLGYRRMPKEMYLNWLFRVNKDTTRKPYRFTTPQPFKKYNYNVTVFTAGDGQNYEFFDQEEVVRIGTVEYNQLTNKIVKFVEPDDKQMPDEVISRMYDPAVGRFWQIDRLSEAYYGLSPYNYVANNPVNSVDHHGDFIVSIHYKITEDVLKKYGYTNSASRIAWYSSMYADNPSAGVLFLNNVYAMFNHLPTVTYAQPAGWSTKNSQDTGSPIESQRHSMTGDYENEMSKKEAQQRGREFGWKNVFKAAKGGTIDKWGRNSDEQKAFGVGIHALQDAEAHEGVQMKDHDLNKDMVKGDKGQIAFDKAMSISESAVLVTEMLNGKFDNIKDGTSLNISGMNKDQFQQVINSALKSKKNIRYVNEN